MSKLLRHLQIEAGEGRSVAWLWLAAFLLGIPRALTGTLAGTLFLARSGAENLPYVYLGTAVAAPLVGVLYLTVPERLGVRARLGVALGTVAVVLTILWGGLVHGGDGWPMALACWCEIEWMLLGLSYWSLANRLFDVRQAKRLFALAGSGDVVAAIVCGFSTAPLVELIGAPHALLLSVGGIFAGLAALLVLVRRSEKRIDDANDASSATADAPAPASRRKDPYVRGIFLLAMTSIMTFYFVDNAFNVQAAARFPDEAALAGFLGRFSAVASLLVLATQIGVTGRVLRRFGFAAGIVALPALVVLGASVTATYGWTVAIAPLFWLGVATKLGDRLGREAFQQQALLIAYQPLPAAARHRTQSAVEGIVEPLAGGLAGVALLALQRYVGLDLVGTYALICALGFCWLWTARRLGRMYPAVLLQAMTRSRGVDFSLSWREATTLRLLKKSLGSPVPEEALYALRLLDENGYPELGRELAPMLASPSAQVRKAAIVLLPKWPTSEGMERLIALASSETEADVKGAALQTLGSLGRLERVDEILSLADAGSGEVRDGAVSGLILQADTRAAGVALLERMARGADPMDRRAAARVLTRIAPFPMTTVMAGLLMDDDLEVRKEALHAFTHAPASELLGRIERALAGHETRFLAAHAFAAAGGPALPRLVALARSPAGSVPMREGALRALGLMRTEAATEELWRHLAGEHRALRTFALSALHHQKTVTRDLSRRKIVAGLIEREARTAAWLREMSQALGLRMDEPGAAGLLARAFEQMFHETRQRVFLLLGLAHDPASIERIRITLLRGGSEAHSYALELLEHLLDATETRLIAPLLDHWESPLAQSSGWRDALAAVAVRAGAEDAPWLASCALYLMGGVRDVAFVPTLEALARSEHPMIRETAEWALSRAQVGAAA